MVKPAGRGPCCAQTLPRTQCSGRDPCHESRAQMDDEDLGGEEAGPRKGKRKKKDLTCWGEPTATQREKARRVRSVWRAAERAVGPLSSTVLQAARTDKLKIGDKAGADSLEAESLERTSVGMSTALTGAICKG